MASKQVELFSLEHCNLSGLQKLKFVVHGNICKREKAYIPQVNAKNFLLLLNLFGL